MRTVFPAGHFIVDAMAPAGETCSTMMEYLWLDSVAETIGNTVLISFEVSILFEPVDEQFFEIDEWLLNKGEAIEVTREENDMDLK